MLATLGSLPFQKSPVVLGVSGSLHVLPTFCTGACAGGLEGACCENARRTNSVGESRIAMTRPVISTSCRVALPHETEGPDMEKSVVDLELIFALIIRQVGRSGTVKSGRAGSRTPVVGR